MLATSNNLLLTSGGACIAKNESKPSSASNPDDSPGVTKSFDPQAAHKFNFYYQFFHKLCNQINLPSLGAGDLYPLETPKLSSNPSSFFTESNLAANASNASFCGKAA